MKKEKLFVCRFGGKSYTIYAANNPKLNGKSEYMTYIGRKRLDAFAWHSFEGALGSILIECPFYDFKEYVEVWS